MDDPARPGRLRPHAGVRGADQALAANQGLYNGFLAAGLVWGIVGPDHLRFGFQVFFLLCVMVAGVYGAATASRRILAVQTLPATLALVAVLLAR